MDFGDFDDDFFEAKSTSKKVQSIQDSNWAPHQSESGWFHTVFETGTGKVDMNVKHFRANHLYYMGKYLEAAEAYTELLTLVPKGNHQREVTESLSRSLLKTGDTAGAVEAAKKFELSCKSIEHFASYHSLCGEIYRKSLDYESELNHLQQAIKVHPQNTDMWLRIAECYGLLRQVDIYSVPFKFAKDKDTTWYAAASLVRVDLILKSGAGRECAGAMRKKRNQMLRNRIQPLIESIPSGFVSKAHEALSKDVYYSEPLIQEAGEFVDLGSSKLSKTEDCDEGLNSAPATETQSDWFEKQWFSFTDSIQDINLYYIAPDNTHGCNA